MEYKKKIWTVGFISIILVIGSLVANIYSLKGKDFLKQINMQMGSDASKDLQQADYESIPQQEGSQIAQDTELVSQASAQSNWYEMYDNASQEIIDKYNAEKDYLTYAANTRGQIVKWGKRNLKVFIEEGEYKSTILSALNEFKNTFSDIFTIEETSNKNLSDIEVVFEARPTANPNSLELGKTMPQYNDNGIIQKSHMQLFTNHPITKQAISKSEIYSTFLHEMGHAIGIVGHSQDENDLMYASSTRSTYSEKDVATVKAMYSTAEMSSETKQQVAQNKLEEAEKYAQKYPKEAVSWINLAQTYYAQNNYTKAAEAYREAVKISPNDANVYIGLASCYYGSKKYDESIECLKYAQALNLDEYQRTRIIELMSYNYNAKGDLDNGYFYTREAIDANPYDKNNLGNFLIVCAKTGRKNEARTYLANYLQQKPEDRNDPALKDFADVFGL